MAKFKFNVKGMKDLEAKLGKQGQKDVLKEIDEEIMIAANKVRTKAIGRVPVDQGFLRNSIDIEGKDLVWIIYASAEYAGFAEFGTKTKVSIPPEMQEVASQFKNKKIGTGKFKEAIAAWMKRKGIPEEALYPIMAKLMNVGQEPKPFMYPSFKEGTKDLIKDINKTIQRYLDK